MCFVNIPPTRTLAECQEKFGFLYCHRTTKPIIGQCELQNMERKYSGLQVSLDKTLHKNQELLQEKTQHDIKHKEMDSKLEDTEEKYSK